MTQARPGDTVRLHYTGAFEDGTTFDSSEGRDPLQFVVGAGEVIPGLDQAIPGMAVGERKTVTVAPQDGYGARHEAAVQRVPRAQIPPHIPLEEGIQLQVQTPEGQPVAVTVAEVTEAEVVLDANHPLAGRTLVFEVEMVEIAAA